MSRIFKFFLPTISALIAYTIAKKLLPKKNVGMAVRGGDGEIAEALTKSIFDKLSVLLKDRPLKVGIVTLFGVIIIQNFNKEIYGLLSNNLLKSLCKKKTEGELRIVCDMINTYQLELHSEEINELILNKYLTYSDKTKLLKIKLDFIINGQCSGKKIFIVQSVIALLAGLTLTFTGTGAITISVFLNALRNLLMEGKISKALYAKILKAILSGALVPVPIPLEELEQFL